jgi:outer membrane protein assembly factor BamB
VAGDRILLSAYRSSDPKQGRGACRLFFIEAKTGAVAHRFDLPDTCGHAGGVAALDDGRIVVADTRMLYVIAATGDKVLSTVALKGSLLGSFADSDGHGLWIGAYHAKSGGTIWRLPPSALNQGAIDDSAVDMSLAIPARVQGLAFDRKGGAWLTVSGSRDGSLLRLDPQSGTILANYAMPAGIEDIAVAPDGRIWAVSEAGSIRWSNWPTNFPVVFAIDPDRLH